MLNSVVCPWQLCDAAAAGLKSWCGRGSEEIFTLCFHLWPYGTATVTAPRKADAFFCMHWLAIIVMQTVPESHLAPPLTSQLMQLHNEADSGLKAT